MGSAPVLSSQFTKTHSSDDIGEETALFVSHKCLIIPHSQQVYFQNDALDDLPAENIQESAEYLNLHIKLKNTPENHLFITHIAAELKKYKSQKSTDCISYKSISSILKQNTRYSSVDQVTHPIAKDISQNQTKIVQFKIDKAQNNPKYKSRSTRLSFQQNSQFNALG